jgi:predicted porin
LGGGLAASFWLEAGLANDTGLGGGIGTTGAFVFNRRSTVSLSSGWGEVRLGRDYVPTFWNDTVFDPFGTNGVGSNAIYAVSNNLHAARGPGSLASTTDNYVRSSNSIGYFLPPNLGGFYGQVMYGFHENVDTSGVVGSPSKRGEYYGGRFGWANGPLDIAAAYGESQAADGTLPNLIDVDNKLRTANLGASFDFGVVKLFGEVSRVEDRLNTFTPTLVGGFPIGGFGSNLKDKYDGALIGLTVPVGAGLIRTSYSGVKFKPDNSLLVNTLFGTTNRDTKAEKFAIGYVHNLSKRTALYATAAYVKLKNAENNPVIMAPSFGGAGFVNTGAGVSGYAPHKAMGYDFGIRHAF